ncbi:AcrR family transcriptional regulator [Duganella sp. 1224]|uniref:TetR/AcrR family transcriptional regulator n=1 Tax=Duganella sp. 1224 TaxID=2587052 RepID=UPI0015CEADEB|nr:TetR/AcrR family transcriptional regulator [Duganella sp. 1224]NYE63343.1 AcrR family transcriptional regulator [Duganella sp. 1224]
MSGKPQYDEQAVIEAAMTVFWRHGYAAASISDLTSATGLSRSSLYQRFGDKEGLFQEAVTHYTGRVLRRMSKIDGATPRHMVEAMLRDFLPKKSASDRPAGCMLARSNAEQADLPDAARALVRQGVLGQHAIFARLIQQARQHKQLPASVEVDEMAWYYLGILHAVMNLPQAGATPAAMAGMVDLAMSVWPA